VAPSDAADAGERELFVTGGPSGSPTRLPQNVDDTATSGPSQTWAAFAGILAVLGLGLVLLRWGARRLA
jgi:hypothetical protein